MTPASIPLGDAYDLARLRTRTRVVRLVLAAALIAATAAAFLVARAPDLSATPLLPPGSTGIIVLDLSVSVENGTLDRMYTGLTQLAASHDRFGLVLFSSRSYEALPPNSPAGALGAFARFFHPRAGGGQTTFGAGGGQFGAGGGASGQTYPRNPWECCFSFGTEISKGLELARSIIVANHISRPSVWLMSDLHDDPADLALVDLSAQSYQRLGIALHVIGLDPSKADRLFFEHLLGARGSLVLAKPSARVRLHSERVFPIGLGIAAAALALLLAANELWSTPFRWGPAQAARGIAP